MMNGARFLTVLGVLLACAVIYAYLTSPEQRRIPVSAVSPMPDKLDSRSRYSEDKKYALTADFSQQKSSDFKDPQRNLFAALYEKTPEVISKPAEAPILAQPNAAIVSQPPQIDEIIKTIPPLQESQSLPQLVLLGSLDKKGEKTVFIKLVDEDEIYLVQQGDVFAENLVVKSLEDSLVVISVGDIAKDIVLSLDDVVNQRLPEISYHSDRPAANINDSSDSSPAQTDETVSTDSNRVKTQTNVVGTGASGIATPLGSVKER